MRLATSMGLSDGVQAGAAGEAPPFPNTYSLDFDGVDDTVNCGDLSSLDAGDFSISIWVYTTTSDSVQYVMSNSGSGSIRGFDLVINQLEKVRFDRKTPTHDATTGYDNIGFTINNWHHIVGTYDDDTKIIKLYLDGVLKETETGYASTNNTVSTDLNIGSYNGSSNWFTGNIDEVSVWNTALSSGDITTLWNDGTPTNLNTSLGTTPVAWYRMGDSGLFFNSNWEIPNQLKINNFSSHSMEFDGVNDVVNCGTLSSLTDNVSELSISFWFTTPDTGESRWAGKRNANSSWISCQLNDNDYIYFIVSNGGLTYGGFEAISSGEVEINTWYHIAFVFDGTFTDGDTGVQNAGRCKIYLNGVSKTLTFTGIIPATTYDFASLGSPPDWKIGIDGNTYGFTDGKIDGVSIWDEALTSGNVTSIYKDGVPNDVTGLGISGLQAYYRLGEDSYWNGTNWQLPDYSKNTLFSQKSLEFDGVNDYIDCGNDSSLLGAGDFTVSTWIKLDGTATSYEGICGRGYLGVYNGYGLYLDSSGKLSFQVRLSGSVLVFMLTDSVVTTGVWHHLVGVRVKNGTSKLYLDGSEQSGTLTPFELEVRVAMFLVEI